MLVGTQSLRGECSLELFANDGGDLRRAEMAQKHELAIANGARDAHEHIVVLGQILKQRLPAPENGCACTQAEFLARDRNWLGFNGLVVDRQVRQANKFFGVRKSPRPAAPSAKRSHRRDAASVYSSRMAPR